MNIDIEFTFIDTLFVQEVDEEMILFDSSSENYFSLDEMGVNIWYLMKKYNNIKYVYKDLLELYDVEPNILRTDLLNFTKKLHDSNLIYIN